MNTKVNTKMLITPTSISYLENKDICVHDLPQTQCPYCLVVDLPFQRDLKQHIGGFINTQCYAYLVVLPKSNHIIISKSRRLWMKWCDIHNCNCSHGGDTETVTLYFAECSSEFIFGFRSALKHIYMECDINYSEDYKGRVSYTVPMY